MVRRSKIYRKTNETNLFIALNIDGIGKSDINTGIYFFDHLLMAFAKHGSFNLKLKIVGDLELGQHHTVEDCGIGLGQAFGKALREKKGINRSGFFAFPMDDALSIFAIDIGGRPYLKYNPRFSKEKEGDLELNLIKEFFRAFISNLNSNIHVKLYGEDDHHKAESIFKSFGKAMKMACSLDPRIKEIPSTKGLI